MRLASSFRDPSGFIFTKDGEVYRQVNAVYQENYDHLMSSGLYEVLVKKNLLVAHKEVSLNAPEPESSYLCIKPNNIPFISYPYEWSFSQLKRAALATLKVQMIALRYGMVLKDASAFNIQFVGSQPIFIDTLSFEKYEDGRPWVAYRQFCQHFLAPLNLISYCDSSLHKLFRIYLDGIPLPLMSKLLPRRTYFKFSVFLHIHLHARAQKKYEAARAATYKQQLSKKKLIMLMKSLELAIKDITWKPAGTEWGDYYNNTNYSDEAFKAKTDLVESVIVKYQPKSVWDMGANTGIFSRLASTKGIPTVAFDIDEVAVEKNYREVVQNKETSILPLIMDISNASPGLGWQLKERQSLIARGPADMTIAVALIHHLTIGGNAPFAMVASFFASFSNVLVIEFVPKSDSQVQKLLASREDVFVDYTKDKFEKVFSKYFEIKEQRQVTGSERIMYVMQKKKHEIF